MPADQVRSALECANEIRLARARLRAKIASGEIFAASVLLELPREARTWTVADLLIAQRRWGDTRTRRFLAQHAVPETKPVGALTERQRRVLAGALDGSAGGRG